MMTCMNKSSSLLFLFGTGSVHTTGKSENKGRSCLASQIEVAEQGVMTVRPSLGDKPGWNFLQMY